MPLATILATKKNEARIRGSKVEPLTSGGPSSGVISHSCSYSLFVARIGELDILGQTLVRLTKKFLSRAIT
jgi:hypothetical protein